VTLCSRKYDGTTETVDTSGTTYSEPETSVVPPGLEDGENVAVNLDSTASSATATDVIVFPERVNGRVRNVAGATVTLTNRHGTHTTQRPMSAIPGPGRLRASQ
jgi:hypothetical protein